jgi:hypothetical protein
LPETFRKKSIRPEKPMFLPLHDDTPLRVIRFQYMSAVAISLHINR